MERTTNGLLYEHFGVQNDIPVVFFAGMNVMPGSNYLCDFPKKLAEHAELFVVYQEAVSGNLLKRGFYSLGTENHQLKAGLELVSGRRFLPVTHSLSSVLGFKLLNQDYISLHSAQKVLPGVITSPFTSVEDLLVDHSTEKPRKVLGIEVLLLFKVLRYCPMIVPFFPLADINAHSNFGVNVEGNIVDRWVNPLTADYSFGISESLNALSVTQRPIGIVTLQDRIFSADEQRKRLNGFDANIVEIDCGHRWMENELCARKVIELVISQLVLWKYLTWSK